MHFLKIIKLTKINRDLTKYTRSLLIPRYWFLWRTEHLERILIPGLHLPKGLHIFLMTYPRKPQVLTSRWSSNNTHKANKGSFQDSSAIQGCDQSRATGQRDKILVGGPIPPVNAVWKNLITKQNSSKFTYSLSVWIILPLHPQNFLPTPEWLSWVCYSLEESEKVRVCLLMEKKKIVQCRILAWVRTSFF